MSYNVKPSEVKMYIMKMFKYFMILIAGSTSITPLTLGMVGWAAAMTLLVVIVVAVVMVRRRRASMNTDAESSIASVSDLRATLPTTENIVQVHGQQQTSPL